eukprot:3904832-Prorocentrum_lima.AAC.1
MLKVQVVCQEHLAPHQQDCLIKHMSVLVKLSDRCTAPPPVVAASMIAATILGLSVAVGSET